MKFFHISDLHIGKRVNGFSMLEDQRYILRQILELVREHRPDGIWIAGDLYDKTMPAAEAVEMADWFLSQLADLGTAVWMISGNHDSAERVAYGGQMMERAGVYVSRVFDGTMQGYCVTRDAEGKLCVDAVREAEGELRAETVREEQYENPVRTPGEEKQAPARAAESGYHERLPGSGDAGTEGCSRAYIWLLPYLRPAQVRRFFPEQEISTTQEAVQAVLSTVRLPHDGVNILLMHQFLAGASVCDSEELSVGGLDQVDVSVVADFDYAALGHLHRPQKVGRETVRYCGSPLKYSFSEAGHQKSVTVVEVQEMPEGEKKRESEGTGDVCEGRESEGIGDACEARESEEIGAVCENRKSEGIGDACEGWKSQMYCGGQAVRTSGSVTVTTLPLTPHLDLREVKGPLGTLLKKEVYTLANREDYLHITLTDQEEILDAIGRLREAYPNIMRLDFARSGDGQVTEDTEILVDEKTPQELFEEFFLLQNGRDMNEEQKKLVAGLLDGAREERI